MLQDVHITIGLKQTSCHPIKQNTFSNYVGMVICKSSVMSSLSCLGVFFGIPSLYVYFSVVCVFIWGRGGERTVWTVVKMVAIIL